MRACPCCKQHGDVWEVEFTNMNARRAVMCFECGTVWNSVNPVEDLVVEDFESIMKKNGISPDWTKIKKLVRVLP